MMTGGPIGVAVADLGQILTKAGPCVGRSGDVDDT